MSQLRKRKKITNRFVFSASTFAFVVFLSGFVACKEHTPEPEVTYPITIEPISMDCECLDTIFPYMGFPWSNKLLDDYWKIKLNYLEDCYLIRINSSEELEAINPFDCQVDIDFSKYTLLGGCILTTCHSEKHQIISLEETENNYILTIFYQRTGANTFRFWCFWKLYPKLKEEKQIIVNDLTKEQK